MQKRIFAIVFCAVLLFFVLPPIVFAPALPAERMAQFSWQTFALAGLAVALWWQVQKTFPRFSPIIPDDTAEAERAATRTFRFLLNQGQCVLTFGVLVVTAGLCELAGRYLAHTDGTPRLLPPESALGWANVLLGTVCAAFYEEVLYRAYVPNAMALVFVSRKAAGTDILLRNAKISPKRAALCEATAVILFALAHRYAGWLAVLNALVAGAVLRRCYRKTGALWTTVVAHTAYNALMLAVSFSR